MTTRFQTEVWKTVGAELISHGYQRRNRSTYYRPLKPDFLGTIALPIATWGESDAVEVNPVVGVRLEPLESLLLDLAPDAAWDFDVTVASPVSNLFVEQSDPRFLVWRFERDEDHLTTARNLVYHVVNLGHPWMEEQTDLSVLERSITSDFVERRIYRIPLILHFRGRDRDAVKFVREELEKFEGASYEVALDYRAFAGKFLKRIDLGGQ